MASRREWDDDDGRTVADMSGIERPRFLVPRMKEKKSDSAGRGIKEQTINERSWENESEFTPQERRMYMLGALKAALFIALAFIVGLGAAVWLMIQVWTS